MSPILEVIASAVGGFLGAGSAVFVLELHYRRKSELMMPGMQHTEPARPPREWFPMEDTTPASSMSE